MKRMYRACVDLLPFLPAGAKGFLWFNVIATSLLSMLDIAAMGLLAVIMTPMMSGKPIQMPLVGTLGPQSYIWLLLFIGALIVLKGVLALAIQWVVTRRFGYYELAMGDRLFNAYMGAPWTDRLGRNTAELVRLADLGVGNTIGGVLLPASSLPAEIATFASVLLVLVIAQPATAAITFVYLGLVAALLYFGINKPATVAGRVNRDASFRVVTMMTEMLAALKEITLRGKMPEVEAEVNKSRARATRARANSAFLSRVPQYVVEAALVGGFILVGMGGYWMGGATQAFTAIALFTVAGFRMVPSLTRFQSVITTAAGPLSHMDAVMDDIHKAEVYLAEREFVGKDPLPENPNLLRLENVEFTYPRSEIPAVTAMSVDIPIGSSLGLVGSSGAGKTTLVDLLLGLLTPSAGSITLDGQNLADVLGGWRKRVGYVPQDVQLFDGTVAQNVALTWGEDWDEQRVRRALKRAQLLETIEARPGGIHEPIGERGLALSGGQRQRLGIARALYDDPIVLVMDEATSALDTATEEAVARSIRELYGKVTVISVAHRLSTIRHNDQVCYLKAGTISARGTFEEVVAQEPEFAVQARLAGLA